MISKIKSLSAKAAKNSVIAYIMVLGTVCLVWLLGIRPLMLSKTAEVAAERRVLPIYCVDRDDNKIAISFDAALGAYRLRRNFTHCV